MQSFPKTALLRRYQLLNQESLDSCVSNPTKLWWLLSRRDGTQRSSFVRASRPFRWLDSSTSRSFGIYQASRSPALNSIAVSIQRWRKMTKLLTYSAIETRTAERHRLLSGGNNHHLSVIVTLPDDTQKVVSCHIVHRGYCSSFHVLSVILCSIRNRAAIKVHPFDWIIGACGS